MLISGTQFGSKVHYYRSRVNMNITKPLKASISMKRKNGDFTDVVIKYERIPFFCYYCGKIGHEEKKCIKKFEDSQSTTSVSPKRKCDPGNRGTHGDWGESVPRVTMKICSWNCQGLGSTLTVRSLLNLSRSAKPDVIFLIETKCYLDKIEGLSKKLKMDHCFSVNSNGASGGLALLWHQGVHLKVRSYDDRIIDTEVVSPQNQDFFLTCVYGDPVRSNRQRVWNKITPLGANRNENWICLGDFNSILSWHEKSGGNKKGNRDMQNFRDMMNFCNLIDLGSKGPTFTWSNKRLGEANTRLRLNRALANIAWEGFF
ncbi:uncharacterized protein LOC122089592 [Macadamia integrifolia]|uniref:uncharacterized protein LOC122089592 n=1 Tax=Macadamia integrifolia TaxID=60698 RepID=UPI001C4E9388|nr:uncharacterized protein LOC122089592 [Macadamia integrifolia]